MRNIRLAAGKAKAGMGVGLEKRAWWLLQAHGLETLAAAGGAGSADPAGQDVDALLQQCVGGEFPFSGAAENGRLPTSMLDSFRDIDSELRRTAEEIRKLPCERIRAEAFWRKRSALLGASVASMTGRSSGLATQLADAEGAAGRVRSLLFAAALDDLASASQAAEELLLLRGRAYLLGSHLSLAQAQVALASAAGGGGEVADAGGPGAGAAGAAGAEEAAGGAGPGAGAGARILPPLGASPTAMEADGEEEGDSEEEEEGEEG